MINCTLYGHGDPTFSYKLYKNPESSPFDRGNGLTAFFIGDDVFNISIDKGKLGDIENLSDLQTWNVESLFAHSVPTITAIFNDALRSATRTRNKEADYQPHKYTMEFVPCIEHYKLTQIAKLCDMNVSITDDNHVIFTSEAFTLERFLQRVFICMFINYGGYRYANKEQIAMFTKWVREWNNDYKSEVCEMLAGRRIGLINTVNETGVELERKVNLHEWKHDKIGELLKNEMFADKKIVDLGCSTGQFPKTSGIDKNRYLGVDIDDGALEKARKKLKKHTFIDGNILHLERNVIEAMDIVLLLEVVEHLEEKDLEVLTKNFDYVYRSEFIIITTPNRDANKLWGLEGLRHKDHKFEFNEQEFKEFTEKFKNYHLVDALTISTREHKDTEIETSFIALLKRNETLVDDFEYQALYYKHLQVRNIRYGSLIAPLLLPDISYVFTTDNIKNGLMSRHYHNTKPFYLGASIAPADVKDAVREIDDYVEHPQYAIDYYRGKGYEGDFVIQAKEMGSRANILIFRDLNVAEMYGYDELITVTSRRGYRFFREDEDNEKYSKQIYDAIRSKFIGYDVIMLDAEITPWQYLGKGLIEREFRNPITLQLNGGKYDQRIKSLAGIESKFDESGCISFLESLDHFMPDEPLRCNIFDILLLISNSGRDVQNGLRMSYLEKSAILNVFNSLNDSFVRYVKTYNSRYNLDGAWDEAINLKREGVVIKPHLPFLKNGTLIQPAIKARTPQFLRLIYGGPNYDEYSHLIKNRNVRAKRARGIREVSLSNLMIESFAKRDWLTLQRAVAAFHSINIRTDGTL